MSNILVYDEDRLRGVTLARILSDCALGARIVFEKEDVIKELKSATYDLIIIDESFLGGRIENISAIRNFDGAVPIIVIGDSVDQEMFFKSFDYKISSLLKRPFKREILIDKVKKALRERELYLENLKTVAQLRQRVNELKVLNEIAKALNSSLDPKEIFNIIIKKTADLVKAEAWSVLLVDENTGELVFEAAAGEAADRLKGMRIKIGQGVAGWVAQRGIPLIVPDVSKDPRFFPGIDRQTKFKTKSILCVPLKSREKVIGIVEVINKIGAENFDQDDLNIFETMIEHATIALQNASLYRQIEHMTVIDDLTKLYNARFCNLYLDRLFIQKGDANQPISLIFLDIDHFKYVNDNFGHLVGSETLKVVGDRIRNSIRKDDVCIRFGGDEYIVILPRTTKKAALVIAETIRQEICKKEFFATDKKTFNLTITLGLATYPEDARDKQELIRMADQAMYEGKETGRNKVVVASRK
ncbi:MAG: diguanylate cyclase [candidate division WOR-3 bacterium]